jgi:hypothetical protein
LGAFSAHRLLFISADQVNTVSAHWLFRHAIHQNPKHRIAWIWSIVITAPTRRHAGLVAAIRAIASIEYAIGAGIRVIAFGASQ